MFAFTEQRQKQQKHFPINSFSGISLVATFALGNSESGNIQRPASCECLKWRQYFLKGLHFPPSNTKRLLVGMSYSTIFVGIYSYKAPAILLHGTEWYKILINSIAMSSNELVVGLPGFGSWLPYLLFKVTLSKFLNYSH